MADPLYMIRLDLPLETLVSLAKRRRVPLRDLDEGQAVHCALGELFRDRAPKPFAIESQGAQPGSRRLYAYTRHSRDELLQSSNLFGDFDLHDAFDPDSLRERRLPDCFPERMAFRVRLCPIVRFRRVIDLEVEIDGNTKLIQLGTKKKQS
ncbi:MAG: hypothetical protein AAFQ82_27890, partial [Myxococcota bacterium]